MSRLLYHIVKVYNKQSNSFFHTVPSTEWKLIKQLQISIVQNKKPIKAKPVALTNRVSAYISTRTRFKTHPGSFERITILFICALCEPCRIPFTLTAHNWQKWKSTFLTCPCHKIYREEAVGLKNSNYTFKKYDFCEYVKLKAISWKFDILSITA